MTASIPIAIAYPKYGDISHHPFFYQYSVEIYFASAASTAVTDLLECSGSAPFLTNRYTIPAINTSETIGPTPKPNSPVITPPILYAIRDRQYAHPVSHPIAAHVHYPSHA